MSRKPILITGTHRSGSTWVGKMVALSDEVAYIHEPFNPKSSVCETIFNLWFTFVNEKNEDIYKNCIQECIDFSYSVRGKLLNGFSIKRVARLIRDKKMFNNYLKSNCRPLLKDPISIFSAEWLYLTFNMEVIVLIRHPAAFVGSLKKANWEFPFHHLLNQPLLINEHLKEFENDIRDYSINNYDIVDQGILIWNIIHTMILNYQNKYKSDWMFLRHEDLSQNPMEQFRIVYERVGLSFTDEIKSVIKDYSTVNYSDITNLKRDSKSNIWKWKDRLTEKEILKIKEKTKIVSSHFYTDKDWDINFII